MQAKNLSIKHHLQQRIYNGNRIYQILKHHAVLNLLVFYYISNQSSTCRNHIQININYQTKLFLPWSFDYQYIKAQNPTQDAQS
jgi:hypothetical protein